MIFLDRMIFYKRRIKVKNIPLVQWPLMVATVIYLLESLMVAGLFSNLLLFSIAFFIGIGTAIISIIKKQYQWAIIDGIICLLCSGLVCYLYSL